MIHTNPADLEMSQAVAALPLVLAWKRAHKEASDYRTHYHARIETALINCLTMASETDDPLLHDDLTSALDHVSGAGNRDYVARRDMMQRREDALAAVRAAGINVDRVQHCEMLCSAADEHDDTGEIAPFLAAWIEELIAWK
jgi:hypothetical protein